MVSALLLLRPCNIYYVPINHITPFCLCVKQPRPYIAPIREMAHGSFIEQPIFCYHAHFLHLTQNGYKQLIFSTFNSVGYTYKHLTHHLAHLSILHMSYYVVPGTLCGNGGGIFEQREVEFSIYPTKNRLSLYRQTQVYVPSYSAGNRVYPTCMQCVTLLAECKMLHDVSYTT